MVEVTLTYVLFGQQFTTNILFLPYDKEQHHVSDDGADCRFRAARQGVSGEPVFTFRGF